MSKLLGVRDLCVDIYGTAILRSISLEISPGQVLGLVGESGSGKSMTAMALIGLLPAGARVSGNIEFNGQDLASSSEPVLCALRGHQISMAFQEPMTALNPLQTIGAQVAEVFLIHTDVTRREALVRAADMLERVGLPNEEIGLERYPFELSGGQRQRVVIAIAVAMQPKLLLADEPTTALDVTTEAQILDLLQRLCREENIAMLFVSHDLAAVVRVSDEVAIMQSGKIVECGPTTTLFSNLQHPYSQTLLAASTYEPTRQSSANLTALPSSGEQAESERRPLLEVKGVTREYAIPGRHMLAKTGTFKALDDVSFVLHEKESLGLVGESGSGKSTLVRSVLGLEPLVAGNVHIAGEMFAPASREQQAALRHKIQVVFQDPYGSFDPRHKLGRIVAEPLNLLANKISRGQRVERVSECLESVGLSVNDANKYPHEFSGGQRQRIAIARALVVAPAIVVLDEATSALDVSVRAQILELLADLSAELGISYLFVSHDLDVVRAVTDRVLIMQAGKIVEQGETKRIFESPQHAYTQSLIGAKPTLHDELEKRRKKAYAT